MLTSRGMDYHDLVYAATERDDDPRCEECDRSIVTVDGEAVAPQLCDSCESDFALLQRAGKLQLNGWSLEVVKLPDDVPVP